MISEIAVVPQVWIEGTEMEQILRRGVGATLGMLCLAWGSHLPINAQGQQLPAPAPDVTVVLTDSSGESLVIRRPLVEYRWFAAAENAAPRIQQARSDIIFAEDAVTSELHAFPLQIMSSYRLSRADLERPKQVEIRLSDGQRYLCRPGFTRSQDILHSLTGQRSDPAAAQVSRMLLGTVEQESADQSVSIAWPTIETLFILSESNDSSLPDADAVLAKRIVELMATRADLLRQLHLLDDEIEELMR